MRNILRVSLRRAGQALLLTTALASFHGCDSKEEVLDVDTPSGGVEVERDKDTGETDIDIDED